MNSAAAGRFAASLLRRSWRIVRRPAAEWDVVRAENRSWRSVLAGHVLPLSLLPAFGWATGLTLTGRLPAADGLGMAYAASVALTAGLSMVCVILLAFVFHLIAPMYDAERNWDRAVNVAGFGTTPVLLAGALLVMPIMVMGSVVAMLHCFVLYYGGLQQVMGCRQSVAAEYVALSCLLSAVATGGVGALGGALGIL